jgi:flagellar protein FlbD
MITLHRLGHEVAAFQLNPDLIMTVEANPDTVITLTTGIKIVVAEPPERVAADLQQWRVAILSDALTRRHVLRGKTAAVRRISPAARAESPRPQAVPALTDQPRTA